MVDFANSTQRRAWFFKDDTEQIRAALVARTYAFRARVAEYFRNQAFNEESVVENSKRYEPNFIAEEMTLAHFVD